MPLPPHTFALRQGSPPERIVMKSNYIKSRTEAMKIANAALKEQLNTLQTEAYQRAAADITEQFTAMHLYVLAAYFGFGEKRLKRFLAELDAINGMMMRPGTFCGKKATPDDVKEYMEIRYNLDITIKELMIEREDSKKK